MNYTIQLYLVYLIVTIVFFLFTSPIWEGLLNLFKKKEPQNVTKDSIYHSSCSKCNVKH